MTKIENAKKETQITEIFVKLQIFIERIFSKINKFNFFCCGRPFRQAA
jgi:hypothetical protein